MGDNYVEDSSSAFCNGSYELLDYTPTIDPPILREEVGQILEWIERKAPVENAARIALLYGKAGIGDRGFCYEFGSREEGDCFLKGLV